MCRGPTENGADASSAPTTSSSSKKTNTTTSSSSSKQSPSVLCLFRYASWFDVFLLALGTFFCVAMSATLPSINIVFGDLINAAASPINVREVLRTALFGMLGVAAYGFSTFFLGYALCGWAAARIANGFRGRFLDAVLRQDAVFFDAEAGPPGALSLALTDDAFSIQNGLSDRYAAGLQGAFQFLFGLGIAFYYGPLLTSVLLSCVPVLAVIMTLLIAGGADDGVPGKEAYVAAAEIATETVGNLRTVFSLNAETEMSRRYDERLVDSERCAVRQAKKVTGLGALLFSIMFVMYGVGFWYGAVLIADSTDGAIDAHPLPESYAKGESPFNVLDQSSLTTNIWCADHEVGTEAFDVCVCGLPWDTLDDFVDPNCGCGYRENGGVGGVGVNDVDGELTRLSSKPPCFSGGKTLLVFFAVLIGAFAAGQIGPGVTALNEAKAAAAKMIAVIERRPVIDSTVVEGKVRLDGNKVEGRIELRDVFFEYKRSVADNKDKDKDKKKKKKKKGKDKSDENENDNNNDVDNDDTPRPVFGGCDLVIEAGTTVALVGESGCGKSTVAKLLQRFYDPDSGSVLLDGVDLKDIAVSDLRSVVGVVSQEPLLFDRSVRENIRYGRPDATDAGIEEAAKKADAHSFVSDFPDGYDTRVGVGGCRLSGGQKQRVAIARAVVRNPSVLILDEATSALDTRSERVVQNALDELLSSGSNGGRKRTTVVIAHRLSTVRNADKIVVLGSPEGTSTAVTGSVVLEQGSHDELMAKENGYYKALVGAAGDERRGAEEEWVEDSKDDDDGVLLTEEDNVEAVLQRMDSVNLDNNNDNNNDNDIVEEDLETGRTKNSNSRRWSLTHGKKNEEGDDDQKKKKRKADDAAKHKANKRRVWNYTKPETPLIIVGSIASVLKGTIFPLLSLVFSEMIIVFYLFDTEQMREKALRWSFLFYALAVASFVVEFVQKYLFERVGERLTRRLRSDTFRAILKKDLAWFEEDPESRNVGALSSTLATDVRFVRLVAGQNLASTLESVSSLLTGVVISATASWEIFLVMLAMVPLLGVTEMLNMKALMGSESGARSVLTKSTGVLHESINGIREIQAFALERTVAENIKAGLFGSVGPASRKSALIKGLTMGTIQAVMFCVYAAAYWFGGEMIAAGRIDFGDFARALFAMAFSASGLGQAAIFAGDAAKAAAALKTIFGIIDGTSAVNSEPWENGGIADPNVTGSPRPRESSKEALREGSASLCRVNFAYPARKAARIFHGTDLDIPDGKVVALVGSSGSGKSSVVQLLERFYDPVSYQEEVVERTSDDDDKADDKDKDDDGEGKTTTMTNMVLANDVDNGTVRVDGKDLRTLDCRWVRANVGLVGQEPVLFNDTIRNNIALGARNVAEVTDAEIEEAARAANAYDFVRKLPDGFDTVVGNAGGKVSGGQKQRIAIARALVGKPKMLLLDEATSALDNESERIVQASLDGLVKNKEERRTTIVIAHRLSTIREADVICVLENKGDGSRVVETGSHEELMSLGKKYKALVEAYETK